MSNIQQHDNESDLLNVEQILQTGQGRELEETAVANSCQLSSEQNVKLLLRTLEPFVHKLDQQVVAVQTSQQMLQQELNQLLSILDQIKQPSYRSKLLRSDCKPTGQTEKIQDDGTFVYPKQLFNQTEDVSVEIEEKSRRLLGLKRRLTLVHSILQTVNSRVKKILLAHDSRIL